MSFAVGALVKARGREWVVLPSPDEDLMLLRPLGGSDEDVTGIYLPLERVEEATFALPSPDELGNWRSCRLLRDAVRLGFRSSAGPFRSFSKMSVDPRPYQLVPLLMALKLDPVRLLIADDVGIGKTVEACLIARELLDRGEIRTFCVLCPPHLAEQWQEELNDKFNIKAELVLPSTARRLEKNCSINQSIFELYPFLIVSLDYIKSDRRRDEFLRTCPDLVIVDEAHTCVYSGVSRGKRHQRYLLVKGISRQPDRHLLLVTATPHSGKENAFRRLISFLEPEFKNLPEDLSGKTKEHHRRRLATHFIQRRRADIRDYLDEVTTFPIRKEMELSYRLSEDYKRLFQKALRFAGEQVTDASSLRAENRIKWWSALAMLRSLASSPAAASATLRNRAVVPEDEVETDMKEIDKRASRLILDMDPSEEMEAVDVAPGADTSMFFKEALRQRRRFLDLARMADGLMGRKKDPKLKKAIKMVRELLADGFSPVIFCRFIPTAEYVSSELKAATKDAEVACVTGLLPPEEREIRVLELKRAKRRILVCTDCLSEGINLQDSFDAVIHYDLSWNPTRHEQREGRVDRFGQPKDEVRVVTIYGMDNQIDGVILDVLIQKHKSIKSSLGISVPVPVDTAQVIETIFEGLLLREDQMQHTPHKQLKIFEEYLRPNKEELFKKWEDATAREKRSLTIFAQRTIKPGEVMRELREARRAAGSWRTISEFLSDAVTAYGGAAEPKGGLELVSLNLEGIPRAMRQAAGGMKKIVAAFSLPAPRGAVYLHRNHPVVEGISGLVMDSALDPHGNSPAKRCGVIRTRLVKRKTVLLLIRYRFHIVTNLPGRPPLLAEDMDLLAFKGSQSEPEILAREDAERLLDAKPEANISQDIARKQIERIVADFSGYMATIEGSARKRAKALLDAHRRVRTAARIKGVKYRVEPHLPADVIGIYVYLPTLR